MPKSLRLLKKFQQGISSKSGGVLHTSLRSKSLSSSPKGAEATQHFTHRPSVNRVFLVVRGAILNLRLTSPLVSKQNNFCE